jgi:hypothetical protein
VLLVVDASVRASTIVSVDVMSGLPLVQA